MIIFLTGFMGAGKSFLARKIVENDREVILRDLDEIIFDRCGKGLKNIGQFIRVAGWDRFREEERCFLKEVVEELSDTPKAIVSLGGGTLLNEENIKYLKSKTYVKIAYVATPFEECFNRISQGEDRPLAQLGEQGMRDLYERREKGYMSCSDAIIEDSENITNFSDLLALF